MFEGRSLLGLSISEEVQEYFFNQLHPGISPQVGGPVTPMYHVQFAQTQPAPPKREAIRWLEEALLHQDNPEGKVTAALALMYGYDKTYDRMIDALHGALTINPSLISYFQHSVNLMMLIYACDDLASAEEVIRIVNLKLPQKDDVQQALREASDPKKNPDALAQPYIQWYAIGFKTRNSSRMPVKVLIAFPGKNGLTYAQITEEGQLTITVPPQVSTIIDPTKLIPIDEVLKRLTDCGIVLMTLI